MCAQPTCMADSSTSNVLADSERRLRSLLPADLYAAAWVNPSSATLMRAFEHLRTLQHILIDYVPRDVYDNPPHLGEPRYEWQSGTLLFTDLAGFTPLLEARAAEGITGAEMLLKLLNRYFSEMIEIISKSGGNLLEFTGDALLVQFPADDARHDVQQAVHAGLRMQRAMAAFRSIPTLQGQLSLQMRVGIHLGRFVKADVGTPQRMGHVLLGQAVTIAKQAEGAGLVGHVCLTDAVKAHLSDRIQLKPVHDGHWVVEDDLTPEELGEYEITLTRRRAPSPMLFDRSVPALMEEIKASVDLVEPLASYLPRSVLQLVVKTAADRRVPPAFPSIAVAFVNLMGLPEAVDKARPEETPELVQCFSDAFSLINGVVELKDGILQKVTYHSIGSEMLIHFGVLNPDPSDPARAAEAVLAIRDLVTSLPTPTVQGQPIRLTCRIGLSYGPVFAAEVGERRGRREFNILGDTVNTAARLMSRAGENEIWINQLMYGHVGSYFKARPLGNIALKGKAIPQPVYALEERRVDNAASFRAW
jgi:adenylate cyclase